MAHNYNSSTQEVEARGLSSVPAWAKRKTKLPYILLFINVSDYKVVSTYKLAFKNWQNPVTTLSRKNNWKGNSSLLFFIQRKTYDLTSHSNPIFRPVPWFPGLHRNVYRGQSCTVLSGETTT